MPIFVSASAPMLLFQTAWTLKITTQKTESSTILDIKKRVILFSMAEPPSKCLVARHCGQWYAFPFTGTYRIYYIIFADMVQQYCESFSSKII